MAIRFTDNPPRTPRKPAEAPAGKDTARAQGEARFTTPIASVAPTNPDASGQLPFADLPQAEAAARKKRPAKRGKPG